jgi:hypothetical protein
LFRDKAVAAGKNIRVTVRKALVAAAILLLSRPALAEVRGVVYEVLNPEAPRAEWRRQPLPSAYVSLRWDITIPAPAHATTSCRYAEIARTDAKGEYIMDGPNFITAGLASPRYSVHAAGRERVNFPYPGSRETPADITMTKSSRQPEERLSQLFLISNTGCFDRKLNDPGGVLRSYLESLVEEARALNVDSPQGRNMLRSLEASAKGPGPSDRAPIRVEAAPVDPVQLQAKDPATRPADLSRSR